jgi:hypothetical protein
MLQYKIPVNIFRIRFNIIPSLSLGLPRMALSTGIFRINVLCIFLTLAIYAKVPLLSNLVESNIPMKPCSRTSSP